MTWKYPASRPCFSWSLRGGRRPTRQSLAGLAPSRPGDCFAALAMTAAALLLLAEFLAQQRGAGAERLQLAVGDLPAQRRQAAIGAGIDVFDRHELHGAADGGRDFLRGFDVVGRDIDRAQEHVLALEQREEAQRHAGVRAFERDLIDAARRQRREDLLVLPPLAPQALLPVDIGLDAVA